MDEGATPTQENSARSPSGLIADEISSAFVSLFKKYGGKGPARCRTYVEESVVIVLLGDGGTAAEQTLFEAGKWLDVRNARLAFQDSMEVRFVDELERLTGREVLAFMSASHQDPDFQVEMFVLRPNAD